MLPCWLYWLPDREGVESAKEFNRAPLDGVVSFSMARADPPDWKIGVGVAAWS
jgi:hypothetical protein